MIDVNGRVEKVLKSAGLGAEVRYRFADGCGLPCVVYFTVSESSGAAWDNEVQSAAAVVQVSVYGRKPAENGRIADAVWRAMDADGWVMTIRGDLPREKDAPVWGVYMRFRQNVWIK